MSLIWSDWYHIGKPSGHRESAIYRIRLCNHEGPIQIARFLGMDNDGILCIGKTTKMEGRRKQFIRGLAGNFGHSEGNLLHILEKQSPLLGLYPKSEYQYSFAKVDLGQESQIEEEQIKAYVRQFGEVPPLNSAIPVRYGNW